VDCDVCVVGAGYTGLWTAYELCRADPSLRVVVLEAEVAGFGASGRNGGAVIALIEGTRDQWAEPAGRAGAVALERALFDAVRAVGDVVERESIDCGYARNGVIEVARSPLELRHFAAMVDRDRAWGFTEDDYRLLDAAETIERIRVDGALGARFSPHCASIQPAALVRGLADAVERAGGTIYEGSPVTEIQPGIARTPDGIVRAGFVLRATEAYTRSLSGERRRIVPVHTSMLVTEQLDESLRRAIGWSGREALLAEHPFLHLQHTRDGRISIGGDDNRVPYQFASAPGPVGPAAPRVRSFYREQLIKLFPCLGDVQIEQSWQGVFGAHRTWRPAVGLDRKSGVGWAGGYVGEGVAASNLAGRTLSDLILGRESALTRLPWVGPVKRQWEPEPLRWLGARVVWSMRNIGTQYEARTGKHSRLISVGNRLAGYHGCG
jgi:glycine/D-amino acid oxidase-like deaminating enzyme